MDELICPRGHMLLPGGVRFECGPECDEQIAPDDAGPVPPGSVRVRLADRQADLAPGARLLLGRDGDPRFADVLRTGYGNVSRSHLEIVVGDGSVSVLPHPTTNQTFLGDLLLDAGEERVVVLPATVRMAANCYVHLDHTPGGADP